MMTDAYSEDFIPAMAVWVTAPGNLAVSSAEVGVDGQGRRLYNESQRGWCEGISAGHVVGERPRQWIIGTSD